MEYVKLKAFSKINLTLNVLGTEGGYHQLASLLQGITLCDELEITLNGKSTCSVVFTNADIDGDSTLALLAYMKERYQCGGIDVKITKGIPVAAGLGGSSCDQAGIIIGLGALLKIPFADQYEIACCFGSDTPFMLKPYTALLSGRGDIVEYLPDLPIYHVLLALEGSLNTKDVFLQYDKQEEDERGDIPCVYNALKKGERVTTAVNMLTTAATTICPTLKGVQQLMQDQNCLMSLMTGSGSAVYNIYNDIEALRLKEKELQKNGVKYIIARFLDRDTPRFLDIR